MFTVNLIRLLEESDVLFEDLDLFSFGAEDISNSKLSRRPNAS